jgi:hypothetical protein
VVHLLLAENTFEIQVAYWKSDLFQHCAPNLLTLWALTFLRSRQLYSYSKIYQHLWNSKDHYRVLKGHRLVPNLSHIDSDHTTPNYHSNIISILSLLLLLISSGDSFPSVLPTKILHEFLFSPLVLHVLLISSSLPRLL